LNSIYTVSVNTKRIAYIIKEENKTILCYVNVDMNHNGQVCNSVNSFQELFIDYTSNKDGQGANLWSPK